MCVSTCAHIHICPCCLQLSWWEVGESGSECVLYLILIKRNGCVQSFLAENMNSLPWLLCNEPLAWSPVAGQSCLQASRKMLPSWFSPPTPFKPQKMAVDVDVCGLVTFAPLDGL